VRNGEKFCHIAQPNIYENFERKKEEREREEYNTMCVRVFDVLVAICHQCERPGSSYEDAIPRPSPL